MNMVNGVPVSDEDFKQDCVKLQQQQDDEYCEHGFLWHECPVGCVDDGEDRNEC